MAQKHRSGGESLATGFDLTSSVIEPKNSDSNVFNHYLNRSDDYSTFLIFIVLVLESDDRASKRQTMYKQGRNYRRCDAPGPQHKGGTRHRIIFFFFFFSISNVGLYGFLKNFLNFQKFITVQYFSNIFYKMLFYAWLGISDLSALFNEFCFMT